MKRSLCALVVLGTLAAAAVEARAEFANSPVVTPGAAPPVLSANAGTVSTAAVSAVDGTYVINVTTNGSVTTSIQLQVNFATPSSNAHLQIYTGTVGGAFLSAVSFTNGSTTDSWTGGTAVTGALASTAVNNFYFGGAGTYAFTSVGGGSTGYNQVLMTFSFPASVSSLQIDAIANPEPGTLALFGLGAAGLGGFAWRRRKARRAASKS